MEMEDETWQIVEKVTECGSCQQDPSQYDRDLLPDKEVKLRWRVWKQQRDEPDDPPGGMWYRVGHECAVCYEHDGGSSAYPSPRWTRGARIQR